MQTRHPAGVVAPTTGVTAYLAPLPDEPSPRAGVRSAALDSTLPAEAFRGPSSQGLTASAR